MTKWLRILIIAEAFSLFVLSTAVLVLLFVGNEAAFKNSAISGLVGALIGGGFGVGAQLLTARTERRRADNAWTREQDSRARTGLHEDVRKLLEELTEVSREVQAATPSLSDFLNNVSWRPVWKKIWTDDRSLSVDVLAELIRDPPSRDAVKRAIRILDYLDNITSGSFPVTITGDLRKVAGLVSANAIVVVARYLRDEPYKPAEEEGVMVALLARTDEHDAWEAHEEERAVKQGEAHAAAEAKKEQAAAKAAARRASTKPTASSKAVASAKRAPARKPAASGATKSAAPEPRKKPPPSKP